MTLLFSGDKIYSLLLPMSFLLDSISRATVGKFSKGHLVINKWPEKTVELLWSRRPEVNQAKTKQFSQQENKPKLHATKYEGENREDSNLIKQSWGS